MRVPKHNWTDEEIMLLEDTKYIAVRFFEMINLRVGNIRNKRKELRTKLKICTKKGISVEEASSLDNLQMLPCKTNLIRNFK